MRKAIRASALIILLACTADAGWMPNGSPEPEPTPPPVQEQTTDGDIPHDQAEALTEVVLTVLSGVLPLV